MIDLGTTDFFIGVPSMPRPEFEKYSTRLFDEWEEYVGRTLALPDYSLALEVEEGSVKGGGRIAVVLGALYIGIGNYGDFFQGIQTIRGQISSVGDFLAEQAAIPFEWSGCETKVRKRGGSLVHLQLLFVKVQNREITSEQAMREAEALLGDEATTAPEFMHKLQESLEKTPLVPQQLTLLSDTIEQEAVVPGREKERRPRPSRPMPSIPPNQQLRIEVWRESKNGKRRVRVIQL
jgi:hypothetical protein